MPLVDNAWYINYGDGSAGAGKKSYFDVTAWVTVTAKVCGDRVRPTAPAVGSERVFICIKSTTGTGVTGVGEPTWTNTRGAITADTATIDWQEATGIAALNGDLTNTPTWTSIKNTAIVLGQVIKNDAGNLILICTVAGTAGNGTEPTWAAFTNAGATTADNTVTWVTLGASFAAWSGPHARLARAYATTWGQAGNAYYIGDNHAETQASAITNTSNGTVANPTFAYCVDRAGSVPPVSADLKVTATITTTGNSAITNAGAGTYHYGISFSAGSGAVNATVILNNTGSSNVTYENCKFIKAGTSASASAINPANQNSSRTTLINSTMQFGATGDSISAAGSSTVVWKNTASAIAGATFPTSFCLLGAVAINLQLTGVDLSALGSANYFVGGTGANYTMAVNCKIGASATFGTTPTTPAGSIKNIICDSAGTNYIQALYSYFGTLTQETTIVRTGGATDGTTPISHKLVSTSNSKWVNPFESFPITIWNDSTTAITSLTIYGTTTGGGVPNNDDIWVEVEYLGSASTPQGSFITTTKANNLAASVTTNNSADGSTWGGGGAGNGFKIVVPSFTPGMKGPLNIAIKVAKASTTYYIDPEPEISGVTVSRSEILAPGVYMNETGSASSGGGMRLAGRGGLAAGA